MQEIVKKLTNYEELAVQKLREADNRELIIFQLKRKKVNLQ